MTPTKRRLSKGYAFLSHRTYTSKPEPLHTDHAQLSKSDRVPPGRRMCIEIGHAISHKEVAERAFRSARGEFRRAAKGRTERTPTGVATLPVERFRGATRTSGQREGVWPWRIELCPGRLQAVFKGSPARFADPLKSFSPIVLAV